jgi:dTDP-4-dehydrorhamnose 3,5-epimerase
MRFLEAEMSGVRLIELDPICDERGFFSRTFCIREFAAQGLETSYVQHSLSYSAQRGTLRGLHFQAEPHSEVKVVDCAKGALWDVILDLRPKSLTYRKWQAFELTAENRRQLYIPAGFAHGFQTLCNDTEARYLISAFHAPLAARGVRYDDPFFAIKWPMPVEVISAKDAAWPNFVDPV